MCVARVSQEIISNRLLCRDATRLLGCRIKDLETFVEMFIQLENGGNVSTSDEGRRKKKKAFPTQVNQFFFCFLVLSFLLFGLHLNL
jgi:hypothetical protein